MTIRNISPNVALNRVNFRVFKKRVRERSWLFTHKLTHIINIKHGINLMLPTAVLINF